MGPHFFVLNAPYGGTPSVSVLVAGSTQAQTMTNLAKVRLIPNDVSRRHLKEIKDLSVMDGDASDELVGGVTAHQGDDQ